MHEKEEVIAYCLTFNNVYMDKPFRDPGWTVIRHKENKKVFAWIFEREGYNWINVKCDPEWCGFWRGAYTSVIPAYHLNKEHWNSIILDGGVADEDIKRMIEDSYELTKSNKSPQKKSAVKKYL